MTVVGSVEVEVRALVNSGTVTKQMSDGLQRPSENAGRSVGKTMGKHVGESAAQELEKSGARFARSGRLLSNVFTSNSAAALGPLQEVADKVELIGSTLERTKTKAGGVLLGIGAAATGVGAFLSTLASREEAATNRLAASIAASGGDIADYREEIEKAVKAGERFGQSGNQTIDAIQALTIGLHDPKKALEELGLAEDIAAAKNIPLSSAANLVRQAYNGNTRVLKAFGIQVSGIIDGQKLLKDAHEAAGKASSEATKAQKDYSDKLAIYRDTLTPTLSQQIALKNSHDKLVTATAAQASAQAQLTDAQSKANDAGEKGQQVLDQLAKVTAGQAAASADTFTGHLKAVGAAIEDNAAKVGGVAGKTLIEFGPALAGAGFLIESGLIPKIGRGVLSLLGFGGTAAATAVEVEGASAAEVASLDTVVAAIRELQIAMTGIGPAADAQAIEVGAATATMDAELAGVGLAAEEAGAAVGLSFTAMLGPIGLAAAATAGLIYLINKAANDSQTIANLNAGNTTATIAIPGADKHKPITFTGPDGKTRQYNADGSGPVGTGTSAPYHRHAPQVPDDYDAKTHATPAQRLAIAGSQEHGVPKTAENPTGDPNLQAFLDSIHGGSVASSGLSKALKDAQKAAGDQAKAVGKTVTDGMQANVDAVKSKISDLNDEIKKMADVRAAAIGQASSFTSLTGLLPDNSLATAAGLISGEHSRNAALSLFGSNIAQLEHRGLDKGAVSEILKEGPERARAIAAALAKGSDAQLHQLNLELKSGRQQAQVLGDQAVTAEFGVGAQAKANAELAKLNRQVATLNKQIAAEPALIAKAVDQAQKNAKVTSTAKSRTAVPR